MPYIIKRFYAREGAAIEVVKTGLTLEEARVHCKDPESSSRTCTTEEGRERTLARGPWFDGYEWVKG
jgi:hypothetical protein